MSTANFLFELGVEELPSFAVEALSLSLVKLIISSLKEMNVSHGEVIPFATPRRVAFLMKDLAKQQPATKTFHRGPSLNVAYDEQQQPTPAARGFARSFNIDVEQLITLRNEKGSWLAYEKINSGLDIMQFMPIILQQSIDKLPINKKMFWGNCSYSFVRPVHWICCLYGNDIVPMNLFGLSSDRFTYGHRFHAPAKIALNNAIDYSSQLKKNFVLANFQERKDIIVNKARDLADKFQCNIIINHRLLTEVTSLVEWPVTILADFDVKFLNLPEECLITSLQVHQRYFSLRDNKTNKLTNKFIFVSNIDSENNEKIIQGNINVLSARLNDAQFFYKTDSLNSLSSYLPNLKQMLFHKKLGSSMFAKVERLQSLAVFIANKLQQDQASIRQASLLSKCDLITSMVQEFPELQGIMGKYYALHDGESNDIAQIIEEHYYPKFAGDRLPASLAACCVALADRIDNIVCIGGISAKINADSDPFGLRRQSIAILRICIEKKLFLSLDELFEFAYNNLNTDIFNNTLQTVLNFCLDKLHNYYISQNYSANLIQAVLNTRSSIPYDIDQRIQSLQKFLLQQEAENLIITHKRIHNILSKVSTTEFSFSPELLKTDDEKNLYITIEKLMLEVDSLCAKMEYNILLSKLTNIQSFIDNFFANTMIMANNEQVRNNRLALLSMINDAFLKVADLRLLTNEI